MRTSGGRGNEVWIVVMPLIALIVVASLSAGGIDGALAALERALRHTLTSVGQFVSRLF